MLEKIVVIDSIEILEDGHMQIREATKIIEDGIEIAKTYHRSVIAPGQDVTSHPQKIKDIAGIIHTEDVVKKYKDKTKKND